MRCLLLVAFAFFPFITSSGKSNGRAPECNTNNVEMSSILREKIYDIEIGKLKTSLEYDCTWEKYAWKRMILTNKSNYKLPEGAFEIGDQWDMQSLTPQVFFETLFNLWERHYNKMKSTKKFGCFLQFLDEKQKYRVNCIFV